MLIVESETSDITKSKSLASLDLLEWTLKMATGPNVYDACSFIAPFRSFLSTSVFHVWKCLSRRSVFSTHVIYASRRKTEKYWTEKAMEHDEKVCMLSKHLNKFLKNWNICKSFF